MDPPNLLELHFHNCAWRVGYLKIYCETAR